MTREKTWVSKQNIALSGANDADLAKNWMYELYTFLSGGAGNSTCAWEIISASNGSSVGGPGTITATGSMTWNSSGAHTWWVCRKNILPVTASTTRYIWMTVDLEDSDDTKAYFSWNYDPPNFSGQNTSTRPAETATTYESDAMPYRYEYDAGNQAYFHGCIDTTGSFHVHSGQSNGATSPSYPFGMSCARVETPRAAEVDPFPIFLKCSYGGSNVSHGGWTVGDASSTSRNNIFANTTYSQWNASTTNIKGGCAMWYFDGSYYADGGDSGWFVPTTNNISYNPWLVAPSTGNQIDGTFALIPMQVGMGFFTTAITIRGRLPDVFCVAGSANRDGSTGEGWGNGGLSLPATGDIEYSCAGDFFFPFSASLQPGG